MQQIAEGLKEAAHDKKKRTKSQELGGGGDADDKYIEEDDNYNYSSQGSLEVLAEDLSDVEQRMEEIIDETPDHHTGAIDHIPDEFPRQKLTQKRLNLA